MTDISNSRLEEIALYGTQYNTTEAREMAKELLKLRGRKVPDAIDGSKIAYVHLDETTTDKLDAYVKGFNACRDKMLR